MLVMAIVALDAYLLEWVFQPLVDRAVNRCTHHQLAEFFLTGACAVELVHAVTVLRQIGVPPAIMSLLLVLIWSRWIPVIRRHDELEQRGYIRPRDLRGVVGRTGYSFCLVVGSVLSIDVPTFRLGWCAWLLATIAIYFIGCTPGRPRKQRVLAPV